MAEYVKRNMRTLSVEAMFVDPVTAKTRKGNYMVETPLPKGELSEQKIDRDAIAELLLLASKDKKSGEYVALSDAKADRHEYRIPVGLFKEIGELIDKDELATVKTVRSALGLDA